MEPAAELLTLYGSRAEVGGLVWEWVDAQLTAAGSYWIVCPGQGHPHPRPVWGVWRDHVLFLSIGSPLIREQVRGRVPVTVHLGGDVDVVIVEGSTAGPTDDPDLVQAYNAKYDWDYQPDEYGAFIAVEPEKVMAWRSAGWAGRDGFRETGRWSFPSVGG